MGFFVYGHVSRERDVMVTPSLQEFLKSAGQGEYTVLRRRMPADLETPVSVFLKLRELGATFLLESVERGIQVGRYSFIGVSPFATVKLEAGMLQMQRGDDVRTESLDDKDPLAPVREELSRSPLPRTEDITGPIAGAVGYMSYDLAKYFEKLPTPPRDELGLPDYFFLFPSALVVFDHVKSEIEIVAIPQNDADAELAYASAQKQVRTLFEALNSPLILDEQAPVEQAERVSEQFNMTREHFEQLVGQAKEHILDGDAFQIVLSQRVAGTTKASPFRIYRALRILNPSPYMFYINFGDFQLIGSSPEMLVKLDKGQATLNPIAGTRPRGSDATQDRHLQTDLKTDEKERAEHVMLVDLGRNDLGRVCEPGSVNMESLMQVEKYSHVMHLVSRVKGVLKSDLDMFDLLRSAFPAGTLTGAPKIRAMEIIADLEREKRGPYGGAVGYFGAQGDMDMCITIRTIVMKGDQYYVQGGAGIVADSDAAAEYKETLDKIQALRRAVSIAEKDS
ncbi:MAG: anthranilate synthase component I [Candidatus Krumholzibacteria bacterium]|nr:anthranilate synthase component I [Candidatus Krumholzibacteria bacterium]